MELCERAGGARCLVGEAGWDMGSIAVDVGEKEETDGGALRAETVSVSAMIRLIASSRTLSERNWNRRLAWPSMSSDIP